MPTWIPKQYLQFYRLRPAPDQTARNPLESPAVQFLRNQHSPSHTLIDAATAPERRIPNR
jgi:hypothetical protein